MNERPLLITIICILVGVLYLVSSLPLLLTVVPLFSGQLENTLAIALLLSLLVSIGILVAILGVWYMKPWGLILFTLCSFLVCVVEVMILPTPQSPRAKMIVAHAVIAILPWFYWARFFSAHPGPSSSLHLRSGRDYSGSGSPFSR
jgi:hypothetical protein